MKNYVREECPKSLIALYSMEPGQDEPSFKSAFNQLYMYSELRQEVEFVCSIGSKNKSNRLKELVGGDIPGINMYPRETVDLLDDAMLFSSLTGFYRKSDMQVNQARYKAYEISPFPKLNIFNCYS